ncbi:hypothetical protein [Actinocorallia populi]|uniref:hypothetical protein n=1 Tax=Actinocorallia populi TaxID=2079200 RepID=UPI000D089850|nr:hypothetical protein [Actinocorallia populi]
MSLDENDSLSKALNLLLASMVTLYSASRLTLNVTTPLEFVVAHRMLFPGSIAGTVGFLSNVNLFSGAQAGSHGEVRVK